MRLSRKVKAMRKAGILFRVVCIVILLLMISLMILQNISRMKGTISIYFDEEKYFLEGLECNYVGGGNERLICEKGPSFTSFRNHGLRHGMYEYSFAICKGDFDQRVKVMVFKTNWWEVYNIDLKINVYQNNGAWETDVFTDIDGYTYHETYRGTENEEIVFRVE